jgi:surface antigen
VLAATAAAQPRPVTIGYQYARACPEAGELDVADRWKMDTCNCTSYVAWALAANGYRTDWFVPGAMDAWNWPNVAWRKRIPAGHAARVGAVAVWPGWGRFGHVAFVTAVHDDGDFDVAEYNLPGGVKFGFDRRTRVSPGGVTFLYVPAR